MNYYKAALKRNPIITVLLTMLFFVIHFEIVVPYSANISSLLKDTMVVVGGFLSIFAGIAIVTYKRK